MSFANPQANGFSDVLATAASTIATALASPIAVGDLVVVDVSWGSATLTASVGDSLGNLYTAVAAAGVDGTNTQSAQSFYTIATVAGTPTVTASFKSGATLTAVSGRAIVAGHYTSTLGVAFDVASTTLQGSSTTPTSASVTASTTNSLVVGSCADTSALILPSAGAGMTLTKQAGDGTTNAAVTAAWKNLASASAVTSNFTFGSAQASVVTVAVFKALTVAAVSAGFIPFAMRGTVPNDARYRAMRTMQAYSSDLVNVVIPATIYCRRTLDLGNVSGVGSRRAVQ